jgi:hypothetical protein
MLAGHTVCIIGIKQLEGKQHYKALWRPSLYTAVNTIFYLTVKYMNYLALTFTT